MLPSRALPDSAPIPTATPLGRLAAIWGVAGVAAILVHAIAGVGAIAVEALRGPPFTAAQWAFAALWVAFMAYTEGYRGFQLRFSPRTVARARALAQDPRPVRALLAPFFCIGYFAGTRRRLITAWGVTFAIVAVVVVVRGFPQPWRGIVDGGVVIGLGWGPASLLWSAWRPDDGMDPQLPHRAAGDPRREDR